ncbi:hypothetical protein STEG23_009247 [Scotinomys teguina]
MRGFCVRAARAGTLAAQPIRCPAGQGVLPTCVSAPRACGGQKKVSDPPELELQVVGRCHVDAGNRMQIL